MYKATIKRVFDLVVGIPLLFLIAIFLLPFVLISFIHFRGSVFFRQARPGKDEKIFYILKLKTMKDPLGDKQSDAERLTWWGKFLRKTSIDELPQIWNVVKGEMSLVGPRPLLIEYLPHYSPEQRRRHEVLPGITGLAQVRGRNKLSWQEKFEYDVAYVDNLSFLLDLKIIFETVKVVLSFKGVSQDGHATFERFNGNPEGYVFMGSQRLNQ